MKNIFKLGLVLFITTAIAGLVLGSVYTLTKGPIAAEQARAKERALRETLPQAQTFKEQPIPEGYSSVTGLEMGLNDQEHVGWTITITTQGYAGPLTFMVGIDCQGVIQGFKVLKHTETPGLGANSTQPYFALRFVGAEGKLNVVKQAVPLPSEQDKSASEDTDATSSASVAEEPEEDLPEDFKSTDIQALTGATITSRAVATGVNDALRMFRQVLKGAVTQ